MNNTAAVNPFVSFSDLFKLNLPAQPTQDTDLIQQLPFIPGLKEILMLRQVHALEHATVWVLNEFEHQSEKNTLKTSLVDDGLLGGSSTDQGFYIYGQISKANLQRAVRIALQRLTSGEWDLAVHPRCGTNLSVGMLLTCGLAMGLHLILPKEPIGQILGLGVAATAAVQLAPELGMLAQRYITTAIPFNLEVVDITATQDIWGRTAHFVQMRWSE